MKVFTLLALLVLGQTHAVTVAGVMSDTVPQIKKKSTLGIQEVFDAPDIVLQVTAPPKRDYLDKTCKNSLIQSLKAPSTAKIPIFYKTEYYSLSGIYLAGGQVDAQNSFGAMLRKPFLCNTIFVGNTKGGKIYMKLWISNE